MRDQEISLGFRGGNGWGRKREFENSIPCPFFLCNPRLDLFHLYICRRHEGGRQAEACRTVRTFDALRRQGCLRSQVAHVTHAPSFSPADYTFRFAPRVAITHSACYTRRYVADATSQAGMPTLPGGACYTRGKSLGSLESLESLGRKTTCFKLLLLNNSPTF